jgi:hypothetical protein
MSLSKSKSWHSNNCLHFLKRAVPLHTIPRSNYTVMEHSQTIFNGIAHQQ